MKSAHLSGIERVGLSLAHVAKRSARLALTCELMRQHPSIRCQAASCIKPAALTPIIKKGLIKV